MEALIALIPWAFAVLIFVVLTCCVVALAPPLAGLVKQEIEIQKTIAATAKPQNRTPVTETADAHEMYTALVPMAGVLEGGPFPPPVVTISAPRRFPTHPIAPRRNRPTVREQIADQSGTQTPQIPDETQEDDEQQIAATQQTQSLRIPRRRYRLSPAHPPLVIQAHDGRWVVDRPAPPRAGPAALPRDELN